MPILLIISCVLFGSVAAKLPPPCKGTNESQQLVKLTVKQMKGRITYCEPAKLNRTFDGQGIIQVYVIVGVDGNVLCKQALNGIEYMKELAANTVQNWKFKPYTSKGELKNFAGVVSVRISWERAYGEESCVTRNVHPKR